MENYGIPIYVINMASSTERLADVTAQMERLNLTFERIEAVVGAELSQDEINKVYDADANKKRHHRNLTPGEIGCYVSHRKAWQKIVEGDSEFALVLEDDIHINDNLTACFELVTKSMGWDFLKISDTEDVKVANKKRLNSEFDLVSYNKVPNRTMAYFLSKPAAIKMLEHKRFFRPVDVDVQCYADFGVSVCGLRPNCVEMSQELGLPEQSDIAKINKGSHSSRSSFFRNLKYRWAMYNRRKQVSYDLDNFQIHP